MTATVQKPAGQAKSANRARKSIHADAGLKPFSVVNGKYVFWFEPAPEGGFSVSCQNVPGVNAEGDTFEEALADAMKCAAFVEKCLAEIAAEKTAKPRPAAPVRKKTFIR